MQRLTKDEQLRIARTSGEQAAGHVVLTALAMNLEECCRAEQLAREVRSTIRRTGTGRFSATLEGVRDSLIIQLSVVPRGYVAEVKLPPQYFAAVSDKYSALLTAACCFWREWRQTHPELALRVDRALNTQDTGLVLADKGSTALFFREADPHWIGALAYFEDAFGRRYK